MGYKERMKKIIYFAIAALVTALVYVVVSRNADDFIIIEQPKSGDTISSPLVIKGEARGNWYFEASFPIKLIDANGKQLAVTTAQAKGDWMTTEFVPFEANLTFTTPTTESGTLILEKDNPSGLPQNADERRIPVKFDLSDTQHRTIKLYFYNSAKDQGPGGAQCSRNGLEAVERSIPVTNTPIQDTIRLLIEGGLTEEEKARGISTEYPLSGLELAGALLEDGILTLEFKDSENRTGGGSCRVGILWFQIEATAKQFPEVKSVRFVPEELFQP